MVKHKKSKKVKKAKNDGKAEDADDSELNAAKKQLKKLHKLNKKNSENENSGQSFIGQAAIMTKTPSKKKKTDGSEDKDEVVDDTIGKLASKAMLNKKNPEKVKKLAKKAIRKIAENEDF